MCFSAEHCNVQCSCLNSYRFYAHCALHKHSASTTTTYTCTFTTNECARALHGMLIWKWKCCSSDPLLHPPPPKSTPRKTFRLVFWDGRLPVYPIQTKYVFFAHTHTQNSRVETEDRVLSLCNYL